MWFQRATDVVRKMVARDIDIGIVGYDMLEEIAGEQMDDLVVVHDALEFGGCHLALAVPVSGQFAEVRARARRRARHAGAARCPSTALARPTR